MQRRHGWYAFDRSSEEDEAETAQLGSGTKGAWTGQVPGS